MAESKFLFLSGYDIWRTSDFSDLELSDCFIGCICTCPKQYKFGIISWLWMNSLDIQFYVFSPHPRYTNFETSAMNVLYHFEISTQF